MPKLKAFGIAAVLVLGAAGAYWIGQREGSAEVSRLLLVWPDLNSLPSRERVFLGMMAQQCELAEVQRESAAVVACLQAAVARPDVRVPQGVDNAGDELDRLLRKSRLSREAATH